MTLASSDAIAFDGAQAPLISETFSLDQVIELGVQNALMEMRVAMPCRVSRVNADGSVNVLPGFKTRFVGRQDENLPELVQLPVGHLQGQDYRVQLPIAVGDTGYCLTMDRRLDAWLALDGSPQSPEDTRTHHLSDAIFLPMLTPTAARRHDAGTDLVMQNGALTLRLKKSGQLQVHNGTQELVGVLDQLLAANVALIEQIKLLQCLTAFGPAPLLASSVAALGQVEAQVTQIRGELDSFLQA